MGENGGHLVLATPLLVNSFLRQNGGEYSGIDIFLDGPASCGDKKFITDEIEIPSRVEGVRKLKKGFKYPEILRVADSIAHVLHAYPAFRERRSIRKRQVELL